MLPIVRPAVAAAKAKTAGRTTMRRALHRSEAAAGPDKDIEPEEWCIFGSIIGVFVGIMLFGFILSFTYPSMHETVHKSASDLIREGQGVRTGRLEAPAIYPAFLGNYGDGYRRVHSPSTWRWDLARISGWWSETADTASGGLSGLSLAVSALDGFPEALRRALDSTRDVSSANGFVRVRCENLIAPPRVAPGSAWALDVSQFESALEMAAEYGLRVLPVLASGPNMASASRTGGSIDRQMLLRNVAHLLEAYRSDKRIMAWDLMDDPNPDEDDITSERFLLDLFSAARGVANLSQPLTSTAVLHGPNGERWNFGELSMPRLSKLRRIQLEASDFVSFRSNGAKGEPSGWIGRHVEFLTREVARPLFCVGGNECRVVEALYSPSQVGVIFESR